MSEIIHALNHLEPATPDKRFYGKLREYRQKGLAWLQIISDNQLGGILADGMGLGKTIQIFSFDFRNQENSSR